MQQGFGKSEGRLMFLMLEINTEILQDGPIQFNHVVPCPAHLHWLLL